MRSRRLLLTALASFSVLATLYPAVSKPLNVLFLFSDDQRHDTIGALGNSHIKTPHLDRLARRSFTFSRAYNFGGNSGAVCIPARNMVMTGKTWHRFDAGSRDKGLGPTMPKVFQAAGYETFYREKSGSANLPHIRKQFEHRGDIHMVNALKTGYAARGIVDDAVKFLGEGRDKDRPFFMYLGLPCPHDPRWAAAEFRDQYDPATLPVPPNFKPLHPYDMGMMTVRDECLEAWPRTPEAIRRHLHDYYAVITGMDHELGRLFQAIDDLSLRDNTLIVFSSDQGIALGSHGLMGKQSLYEDVQKVPLLIAGPGIKPGSSDAFAYLHDLLPTFCDLAGLPAPENIDGTTLAPVITGKQTSVRDTVTLAYCDTQRSVRGDRWKLIRLPQINKSMLFDLANDPHETTDLASDPEKNKIMERMTAMLRKEQQRLGDTLPLTAARPKPAAFTPKKPRIKTAFPAGGLAPGAK